MRLFLLDNYDSFVYNLASYFLELNVEIIIRQPKNISVEEIRKLNVQGIIISPGPGKPEDAIFSLEVLSYFQDEMPILGVCLGHQVICHYFGAKVQKGIKPMHGKISSIRHNKSGLFGAIESPLNVTRYHSLCVAKQDVPCVLSLDAISEDDVVMAISHKEKHIYGLQFHPEALLSEKGHEILANFIKICEQFHTHSQSSITTIRQSSIYNENLLL